MNCPFCNKEMIKGKVCSNDTLWWTESGIKTRLNDEGGIIGRLNGDRISAYRCNKCKKIIIDEK